MKRFTDMTFPIQHNFFADKASAIEAGIVTKNQYLNGPILYRAIASAIKCDVSHVQQRPDEDRHIEAKELRECLQAFNDRVSVDGGDRKPVLLPKPAWKPQKPCKSGGLQVAIARVEIPSKPAKPILKNKRISKPRSINGFNRFR